MKKDLYLKRFLHDERRFADLVNGFAANGREVITAESLSNLGSQTESTRTQKYRDRLKKAVFGVNFMVIGIEGQEETNYLMPMRCMSYDATEYERQAAVLRQEVKKREGLTEAEWLSGFTAEDRLHPCVTLVLYFGEQWDGAKTLHELLDFSGIPEELSWLVNDYRVHVLEVQKLTDTSMFHTDVKQVLDAVRFSKDPEKFRELIFSDPAYQDLDVEAYDVIAQYTRASELKEIRNRCRRGRKIDMCQALTMMLSEEKKAGILEGRDAGLLEGRNAGLLEGKQAGLLEGRNAGLLEGRSAGLLEGKISCIFDLLSELAPVPETISRRIQAEKDSVVLSGWVKLAAKAETLEDFEKRM